MKFWDSIVALALLVLLVVGAAVGQTAQRSAGTAHAPYAGQQVRAITSLSADDIEQLAAGKGWGLAKPAELNGYPGPMHVLELADKLGMTAEQRRAVAASFGKMQAAARAVGAKLIEAERAIDDAFRSGKVEPALLGERVRKAETLRAELRLIHLGAHLQVSPILTRQQLHLYSQLRGYAGGYHQKAH
jgi:Spy/CpxP family protein refolding chaperone